MNTYISFSELVFIIFDIGIIFIILFYIIRRISFNLKRKRIRDRVETSIKSNKEQELVEEDGTKKKVSPINDSKQGVPENFRICCNCSKELNTTDDHNYQMGLDDYGVKFLCARCSYSGFHFKFFLDQLDKIVCLPQKDEINK